MMQGQAPDNNLRTSTFELWKQWIRNSYRSFMALPGEISSYVFGLWLCGIIIVTFVSYLVAYAIGGIVGFLIPFWENGAQILAEKLSEIVAETVLVVNLIPLVLAVVAVTIVLNLSVGLLGAVVGFFTSFLMPIKKPHNYWVEHDARRIARSTQIDQQALNAGQFSNYRLLMARLGRSGHILAGGSVAIVSAEHFKYADFNPNLTRCLLTNQPLYLSEAAENNPARPAEESKAIEVVPKLQVIKASNGRYYLKSAFDDAKQQQDTKVLNISYAPEDILPTALLQPYKHHKTECAILADTIAEESKAVRTIYGHYFDRDSLLTWLTTHTTCPVSRNPLTKDYICGVKEDPIKAMPALKEKANQPQAQQSSNDGGSHQQSNRSAVARFAGGSPVHVGDRSRSRQLLANEDDDADEVSPLVYNLPFLDDELDSTAAPGPGIAGIRRY